jgi:hypothetical protein
MDCRVSSMKSWLSFALRTVFRVHVAEYGIGCLFRI